MDWEDGGSTKISLKEILEAMPEKEKMAYLALISEFTKKPYHHRHVLADFFLDKIFRDRDEELNVLVNVVANRLVDREDDTKEALKVFLEATMHVTQKNIDYQQGS